jgi:endonuclease/exonuclease/phosphatase family metal-dependent hydrolase
VTIGPLQNSSILTEKRLCSPIKELHLPAITQSSDSFRDHIDLLSELVSVYNEIGTVILMGDFNSKIGGPRYQVTKNIK